MKTRVAILVAVTAFLGFGGKGCGPDPGPGTGGSLNVGGSPALGGFVASGGDVQAAGGSAALGGAATGGAVGKGGAQASGGASAAGGSPVVDASPPCSNACCTTCGILSAHGCPEGLPQDGTSCEEVCLNAETGPEMLRWTKLTGDPSLATIRLSYDCTGGK